MNNLKGNRFAEIPIVTIVFVWWINVTTLIQVEDIT